MDTPLLIRIELRIKLFRAMNPELVSYPKSNKVFKKNEIHVCPISWKQK